MTGCTIGGGKISSPIKSSNDEISPSASAEFGETEKSAKSSADNNNEDGTSNSAIKSSSPSQTGSVNAGDIPPPASSNVRPDGSCALPHVPHGEREDSKGIRFGLQSGSRLEFQRLPDSFDNNIIFSIQMRATAANGILCFVTNEKHSDFMALYMQEGRIFFTFGSGNARVKIILKEIYLKINILKIFKFNLILKSNFFTKVFTKKLIINLDNNTRKTKHIRR